MAENSIKAVIELAVAGAGQGFKDVLRIFLLLAITVGFAAATSTILIPP